MCRGGGGGGAWQRNRWFDMQIQLFKMFNEHEKTFTTACIRRNSFAINQALRRYSTPCSHALEKLKATRNVSCIGPSLTQEFLQNKKKLTEQSDAARSLTVNFNVKQMARTREEHSLTTGCVHLVTKGDRRHTTGSMEVVKRLCRKGLKNLNSHLETNRSWWTVGERVQNKESPW